MQEAKRQSTAAAAGEMEASAEAKAFDLVTRRVHHFRLLHPWWFGIVAFVVGAFIVGLFTMTTYGNWAFEGINLKRALYQVVFGSLGGGIVAAVLAFAYASAIRPTLGPMKGDGVIGTRK